MSNEFKLVPVGLLEKIEEYLADDFEWEAVNQIRSILAAPVSPAGEERIDVEMLKGGKWRLKTDPEGVLVRFEDHQSRVTRLQAEVMRHEFRTHCHLQRAQHAEKERDALKAEVNSANSCALIYTDQAKALQSELTKARELIRTMVEGEINAAFLDEVDAYLIAHQSAPAAKDDPACTSCDGSGEYTDALGDWRGYCSCTAGIAAKGEPNCLLCLDKKTIPGKTTSGFVQDCPDCCGEEG